MNKPLAVNDVDSVNGDPGGSSVRLGRVVDKVVDVAQPRYSQVGLQLDVERAQAQ